MIHNPLDMGNITVQPLSDVLGVSIRGIDVSRGLDAHEQSLIAQNLVEHKAVLIPDQKLAPEEYAAFGRSWTSKTRADGFTEMNVPGFDDINIVGNVGALFQDEAYRNGASFWHTDCAAETEADAITMLYCLYSPITGGRTMLADMQAAYSSLEDDLKARIAPLTANHCYAGSRPILGGFESWEFELTPVTKETAGALPDPVQRPVVRAHSVSGRKGLYAPAGSIFSINEMAAEDAYKLMHRLKTHATQRALCYAHQYRPGDLLMWDNSSTMHYGEPVSEATRPDERRMMHRMCALGIPTVLLK